MTQKGPADRGPFAFRVSFNHEQNHTKSGCLSFTCSPFHQVLALPIAHHCAGSLSTCVPNHIRAQEAPYRPHLKGLARFLIVWGTCAEELSEGQEKKRPTLEAAETNAAWEWLNRWLAGMNVDHQPALIP